jgi:sulfate transport system substrate-binding protein
VGDVLLAWENEAYLAVEELSDAALEIITPSISILAEPPVTVVDKNVERRGSRALAEAYLKYLYDPAAQDLVAKHHYRPRDEATAARYAASFPKLDLMSIADFGGWAKVQKRHFADGGVFDQIYRPR